MKHYLLILLFGVIFLYDYQQAAFAGINLDDIAQQACVKHESIADFNPKALRSMLEPLNVRRIDGGSAEINWYYLQQGDKIKTFRLKKTNLKNALVIEHYKKISGEPRGLADAALLLDMNCRITRRIDIGFDERGLPIRYDGRILPFKINPEAGPLSPSEKGKVTVAVVDSGVNYLLPEIRNALAVDLQGHLIGYDYIDLDDRPYDEDFLLGSLFFPSRHGTNVASVLINANPRLKIAPIRHPATKPERYTELFKFLSSNGVRIVNISIGGDGEKHWRPFRDAAIGYPGLIILSAGNEAANLDAKPRFPASFKLPNTLVVMALDKDGNRLKSSNYGVNTVDVAVVADKVPGFRFDGKPAFLSDTSHAAPLVAALAARLLEENPRLTVSDLKNRIIKMARQPSDPQKIDSKYGQIKFP